MASIDGLAALRFDAKGHWTPIFHYRRQFDGKVSRLQSQTGAGEG
jgi:hypothetical protein